MVLPAPGGPVIAASRGAVVGVDEKNPAGLVRSRLTDGLPPPPAIGRTRQLPQLRGKCDNPWIQNAAGKLVRCPRCHPRA